MIRVAILGAGIGREHLAGYRALPKLFEVRWLCDLDEARAGMVLDAEPVTGACRPQISGDLAAVLADPQIDLVDVCLPPHLHVPVAIKALRACKHVVLEKPIAPCLAECDLLTEAEAQSGRRVFPVFQYRYGPATAALEALMAAGLTGPAQAAALETHWNRGPEYYAVPWRGTWAGERGGAILGHAIHNHDLLCRFFGAPVAVQAMLATRVNPIETEDCAAVALRFDDGAVATSSVTLGAASDTSRLRLVFAHLTAESGNEPYAPALGPWSFRARDPARQPEIDHVLANLPAVHAGFAGFFEAVAKALAGDDSRAVTLPDGRRSIELVTAIYQAARAHKEVALPLTVDAELYRSWLPEAAQD